MSDRYARRILDHLAHDNYRPESFDDLARGLRVDPDDAEELIASIDALLDAERVERAADGRLRLPRWPDEATGRIRISSRGFGFVIPEHPYREGDLFIPPNATLDAISGDTVRVKTRRKSSGPGRGNTRGPGRGELTGIVVEVLERDRTRFVGTVVKERGSWFVRPDGRELRDPILIRDAASRDAREGLKVVVDILHFPTAHELAEGVIVEVLGEAGRPDVETEAVLSAYGIVREFAKEAVEEARETARRFANVEEDEAIDDDREDLTGLFVFTIDPPDAKDFDDAISIELDPSDDTIELGVHIADVAHFVPVDGPLDRDATERGNSVYLPRLVVPMLPEVLSNGVCSLQEGVPRFVKSAFIRYDRRGRVQGTRFRRAVIRSRKRLTYLEAQALIDGDPKEARKHARTDTPPDDALVERLKLADSLAKAIRKERFRAGMIHLDLPETELVFDDEGHVIDAEPEDDAFTHTLIEMFMVAANEAVASLFADLQLPLLRRIHPEPPAGDIEELRSYARLVRFHLPEEPQRQDMQALVRASAGTPFERAINFAVLRTQSKATYSPMLIGHYALASQHYAHFTSPIRRYPDLTVHRALEAWLDHTENGMNVPGGRGRRRLADTLDMDDRVLDDEQLVEIGRHCSDTERNAEDAERSLRSFLVLQFLQANFADQVLPGIVTSVMKSGGVFVMLDKYLADGMVRPDSMPSSDRRADRWSMHEGTGRLVAARGGASVGVGDRVEVRIVAVDLAAREMDLEIVSIDPASAIAIDAARDGDSPRRAGSRADTRGRFGKGSKGGKPTKSGKRTGYKAGRRGRKSR